MYTDKPEDGPASTAGKNFIKSAELARRLHRKRNTIEHWRQRGYGPSYVRVAQTILYDEAVVQAWISVYAKLRDSDELATRLSHVEAVMSDQLPLVERLGAPRIGIEQLALGDTPDCATTFDGESSNSFQAEPSNSSSDHAAASRQPTVTPRYPPPWAVSQGFIEEHRQGVLRAFADSNRSGAPRRPDSRESVMPRCGSHELAHDRCR